MGTRCSGERTDAGQAGTKLVHFLSLIRELYASLQLSHDEVLDAGCGVGIDSGWWVVGMYPPSLFGILRVGLRGGRLYTTIATPANDPSLIQINVRRGTNA